MADILHIWLLDIFLLCEDSFFKIPHILRTSGNTDFLQSLLVSYNLAADETYSDVVLQAAKDGHHARQEPC